MMIAFAMTNPQIDIFKTALEWAEAAMVSSAFFAVFGLMAIVLLIDTNANQRLIVYKQALTEAREAK